MELEEINYLYLYLYLYLIIYCGPLCGSYPIIDVSHLSFQPSQSAFILQCKKVKLFPKNYSRPGSV